MWGNSGNAQNVLSSNLRIYSKKGYTDQNTDHQI